MKKSSVKVAVRFSKLNVTEKIKQARFIVDNMINNGPLFPNPDPSLAAVSNAINDVEIAWNETADGGKMKTKVMYDKVDELMKLIYDLANYVQKVADGDTKIIHAAGFTEKKTQSKDLEDFTVEHGADRGTVFLRVRARTEKKTLYRWEYCEHPLEKNSWKLAKITDVSSAHYGDLPEGVKYWFRVLYVGGGGEVQPFDPKSIIVL